MAILFSSGQVVVTRSIAGMMEESGFNPGPYLGRHLSGDWGDLSASDKKSNDSALRTGEDRIFSAYDTPQGRIWIITEWDRSVTTVLLPEDY